MNWASEELDQAAKGFLPGVDYPAVVQLKNHVDRDKVLEIQNMAELYPNNTPPQKVLTERGQRLYLWFYAGGGLFMGASSFA